MSSSELDLIVVGGGVFGLSTAHEAARRGRRTLVLDRRTIPNSIGASYGPSRKIRSTYLDPHYSRLAREAMRAWREVEAEVGRELYCADGNLNVTYQESQPHLETFERNARSAGAQVRWLEADDLRRQFPQFRGARRALLEVDAGFLRATSCVEALAELATRHGAELLQEQEVTAIEPSGSGLEVRAGGRAFRAPQVVYAGGGWSRRLLPELGQALWQCQQGIMYVDDVPQEYCRPGFIPFSTSDNGYYGFAAEPGGVGLKIARHLVTDPIDDPDFERTVMPRGFEQEARSYLQEFLGLDPSRYPIRFDSCMYNLSNSNDFLLDFHPRLEGLFIATAGSGHGFKFGSMLGKIVVDRLDGVASDRWSPLFAYDAFLAASSRPRLL
jgi:glycine/D-amino acid oxidase-like deaminating enzyme